MIGQSSIIKKYINGFNSIEPVIILVGPKGSGKKTLLKTLASMSNLETVKLPKVITDEIKTELYTYSNKSILYIDLTDNLQYKQIISAQNSLLKFIEDIPSNYRLFILAEDESYLLDTILNRCYIQKLEQYTNRELKLIAKEYNMKSIMDYSDKEFEYLDYPKDVLLNIPIEIIHDMEDLVDTIFNSIGKANISNTLSIVKRLEFNNVNDNRGDNNGLWDINIFLNVFTNICINKLVNNYSKQYFDIFTSLIKLKSDIRKVNVNKVYLFEKFLLDIKQILCN